MNKSTSQKTGGCKAASGNKLNPGWLNLVHSKVPEAAYQSLKIHAHPQLVTLAELREEKERVEKLAREHALAAALEYYFHGCHGIEPEKNLVNSLKHLVFTNWLAEHQFTEKFEPLCQFAI